MPRCVVVADDLTGAGICAPILEAAGANMMLGAFAACIGSLFFSYFNDSYFWVVNNLMGIKDTKEHRFVKDKIFHVGGD